MDWNYLVRLVSGQMLEYCPWRYEWLYLLCAFKDIFSLWKLFCPCLHANAPNKALTFYVVLRQPADQKTGSNMGGGDLSDWSQMLFHLFSAMPAHTLMLHFPHAQGRESPQRELSERTLSVSISRFQFRFNWFIPDRNMDQDRLSYALQFCMHLSPLMWKRVNMCLLLLFLSREPGAFADCDCTEWFCLNGLLHKWGYSYFFVSFGAIFRTFVTSNLCELLPLSRSPEWDLVSLCVKVSLSLHSVD